MRLVPSSTYRRMPWKNAGGETIEVAVFPDEATLDSFDWRVSMARVERPGPFSIFPDVDRTLAVLEGDELVLRFAPDHAVTLAPFSHPYAFPADIPVEAMLPKGPIVDLNVMSRRGRVRHDVQRVDMLAPRQITIGPDESAFFLKNGTVDLQAGNSRVRLTPLDAAIVGRSAGTITVDPLAFPATLYVAVFRRQ